MSICEVCGNDYAKSFDVRLPTSEVLTFDSLECAIHRIAPRCAHCAVPVIGHGLEDDDGRIFCCASCARSQGTLDLIDRGRLANGTPLQPDPVPRDAEVDEALDESFPASDPPSFWAREP